MRFNERGILPIWRPLTSRKTLEAEKQQYSAKLLHQPFDLTYIKWSRSEVHETTQGPLYSSLYSCKLRERKRSRIDLRPSPVTLMHTYYTGG